MNQAELQLNRLRLWDYLEPTTSYLSIVELGLYDSTGKTYGALRNEGRRAAHSAEWNQEIEAVLNRQREAMRPRLYPEIPPHKYLCFYPMDRRRGEAKNWYMLPMAERARQMHEHGLIGRRYAGEVKQIISGSIGFDDWEWGVDLFAEDPLVFKKLIYEMRFDEVSAIYALFGSFHVGIRTRAALGTLCGGRLPVSRATFPPRARGKYRSRFIKTFYQSFLVINNLQIIVVTPRRSLLISQSSSAVTRELASSTNLNQFIWRFQGL